MSETRMQSERAWAELETIVGRGQPAASVSGGCDRRHAAVGVIAPGTRSKSPRFCVTAAPPACRCPARRRHQTGAGESSPKGGFCGFHRAAEPVIEHAWDDMTATVEAGCTIAELQSVLRQHGQRLAADPMRTGKGDCGRSVGDGGKPEPFAFATGAFATWFWASRWRCRTAA